MGEYTKIAWADSTWNPWIGCTHAGTGCDHCYAETQNKYRKWNGGTWGNAAPRKVTAKGYWRKPLNWEDQARAGRVGKDSKRWLVFAGDLCDIFDRLGDNDARTRMWELFRRTPHLTWLILTKRPQHISEFLPADWGEGYRNVWLGVTVENRENGWGRVRYAVQQLMAFPPQGVSLTQANLDSIPPWNAAANSFPGAFGIQWISYLESIGVFFSNPLDLDFSMLQAFPKAYGAQGDITQQAPSDSTIKSVLGKSHGDVAQYASTDLLLFDRYHSLFKLGSKPVEHLLALSQLSDVDFKKSAPAFLTRLGAYANTLVTGLPE